MYMVVVVVVVIMEYDERRGRGGGELKGVKGTGNPKKDGSVLKREKKVDSQIHLF